MGTKLASKTPNKLLEQKGTTEKVVFLNGDEIFTWIEVEKMWGLQKMKGQPDLWEPAPSLATHESR